MMFYNRRSVSETQRSQSNASKKGKSLIFLLGVDRFFLKKCRGAKIISQLVDLTNLLCRAELCKCSSGKNSWRQGKMKNALVHHTIVLDFAVNCVYGTISKDLSII